MRLHSAWAPSLEACFALPTGSRARPWIWVLRKLQSHLGRITIMFVDLITCGIEQLIQDIARHQ